MHEADREHSSPLRIVLDDTFHPILVISPLVEYDENFALFKLQLVVIVSIAVVESATSLESSL